MEDRCQLPSAALLRISMRRVNMSSRMKCCRQNFHLLQSPDCFYECGSGGEFTQYIRSTLWGERRIEGYLMSFIKKMLRKIVKHVSGMLEIIWILLNLDNSISYYLIINIENGWFPSLYLTLTLPMCAISRTRHCSRVHCSLSLCCFPLHFVSFHCSPPSNHFILKQISEKVCQFHF